MACNFCGGLDHFVRICPKAEEYVKAGKCKRMEDRRLVLPNGMFLPRYIQGATMQERFDKYVAQYANFVTTGEAAATMLWSVVLTIH